LLSSIERPPDEKRSECLWTDVQLLLTDLGLTINDIDVFAVCVGPGGFTGLRVGIAAVKGFSAATNKPIVGVTSLEATAVAARPAVLVCAMVNAYKDEVYSQLFSFDCEGVPLARNEPMVSSLEEALDRIADMNEVVFAGDGAEAGAQAIRNFCEARNKRKWVIKQSDQGLAPAVAGLAFLKDARGEANNAESVKACYVRPSEAEIKLSLGLLGSKIKRSMKSE
jgi:tRNA threonylcarbamoyladenosine biosynthesis protein TsaB